MTTYRYLGWGKTNSDGIAKLDHNSEGQEIEHSYTGTGAGEIDVLASLDNPIVDSSIVSVPCNVLDCAFLDAMTTGKKNNKWVNQLNCYTVGEPTDSGTKLTKVSNGNYTPSSVANSTNWNDKLTFTPPLKVEFEITDINGTVQFRVVDSNSYSITLTTGVYEVFIRSTGITFKRNDGTEETLTTNSIFDCNVTFATSGSSGADITIKDFKVYPI